MGNKMKIKLVDLVKQHEEIKEDLFEAFERVLSSGIFIFGPELEEFEQQFANYCGVKHAIGVGNGTDALTLALRAVGVGEGDEVITTPFTFIATAEAAVNLGATPVFVDIEEKSFNIDVSKIEDAITHRTKAIVPVHLYGQPADMDEINKIATDKKIFVIEDAAQAIGAEYKGKKTGSFGIAGCFSLFPTKNLSALGDGGMVTTNDDEFAQKIRMLRIHGSSKKYYHEFTGYNSRLDALQAAFLKVKIKKIDEWNKKRNKIAEIYNKELKEYVIVPEIKPDRTHVFHQYTIRTEKRDELRKYLKEKGIDTAVHYPIPLHMQPAFSYLGYKEKDFPVSERISKEVLSLPVYPEMTDEMVEYVVENIKSFFKK